MTTTGDRRIEEQERAVDAFLEARNRQREGAAGSAEQYERCQESVLRAFDHLVRHVAYRNSYRCRYREQLADLMQVGRIGMLTAMRDFDPGRGTPFAAFAARNIQYAVGHHLRDNTWAVHVPRGAKERRAQIAVARQVLTESLDRTPTVAELAQFLNTSTDEVLQAMLADEANSTYALDDVPAQGRLDPGFDAAEVQVILRDFLAGCSPVDRQIFLLDLAGGTSQRSIAQLVGVSPSHVSRRLDVMRQAFHKLLQDDELDGSILSSGERGG